MANEHDANGGFSRREFLKTSATVGGGAFLGSQFPWGSGGGDSPPSYLTPNAEYPWPSPRTSSTRPASSARSAAS